MDQDNDKTFTTILHTLVRQFHSVATPENIRGSFDRPGFSYNTGIAAYVLKFSKERMMESAGFRQLWEFDVPLESLSMRRQRVQFEFVNEESFQSFDSTESAFHRGIVRKSCISFVCIFTFSPYMM
jgi:hypothetical protein